MSTAFPSFGGVPAGYTAGGNQYSRASSMVSIASSMGGEVSRAPLCPPLPAPPLPPSALFAPLASTATATTLSITLYHHRPPSARASVFPLPAHPPPLHPAPCTWQDRDVEIPAHYPRAKAASRAVSALDLGASLLSPPDSP